MTLTAVLFAGGISRRMGTDKAFLQIGGEPLWARQLQLLRQLRPEVLWISAPARPAWCPPDMEMIFDAPPSSGPLGGLSAALRNLTTSHLLALAIDLPKMTVEWLGKLRGSIEAGAGIVPEHDGLFEPLCAIYPREASPFADAALAAGELSLQRLVARLRSEKLVRLHSVSPDEQHRFLNLNSPADLQKLRSVAST